jgi:hypothetical protein
MTLPFRRRHNDEETSHDRARALSSRRLLESLDADEEAWLGRHFETCTECQAENEGFAADQALLRSLREQPIEPPRDLWARTSAALDAAAGNRGTLPFERQQRRRPGGGGANRWWRSLPVGMAAAAAVVLVLVGSAVLPGLVGRGPQATDQTAVGPSVVPGPTAITVDTAAILAARVRADGSIDVSSTEVDKVCPTSRLECVPAPSQHQGSTLDLQGAKASTVTLSPNNDRLVFESASGPSSEGKIYVMPVGTAGQPSQQPATPPASPSSGSNRPSEPPVSGGPTPEPTPVGQVEILSGATVVGEVAYSPDGHWLAFSAAPKDGSTGPDLYLYAVGSTAAAVAVSSDHQTYFSAWLGNQVLASHIAAPAGEPAASGKPNASKGPDASGNGNNGQGNGGQAQAIVGHASSFLFDPTTHARTDLGRPDVWMPVVDAHSRFVTYWAGTLRSTDGVEWQLGDGQVVLDGWNAGTSTTPGASAEAPTATDASASPEPAIGPAGHPTPVVTSHVEDFRAKFDPEGIRLAVWVSERAGEADGRLHLLVIDPATGSLRPGEPLSGVPALRRFSIDENRLAWVSPSGQDGHESALTVLGWDGDTFGQIHAEQDANLLILR